MTLAEKNFIKKTPAKGFRRHFSLTDRLNKTQVEDNNDTKHCAIYLQCTDKIIVATTLFIIYNHLI